MKIAVIEPRGGLLAQYMSHWGRCQGWQIDRGQEGALYDLLLVAPGESAPRCAAHTLVVHHRDAVAQAGQVAAQRVITYGTSQSTLCLSSGAGRLVALQREIVDCLGNTWEIGEVRLPQGHLPQDLLAAAAGGLLACGWNGFSAE